MLSACFFIEATFTMGATWFEMYVFYGIVFDTDKVQAISKAISEMKLRIPDLYTLGLLEHQTHSRTDGEYLSDMFDRCQGFLGIIRGAITAAEVEAIAPLFHSTLEANKELLSELGVENLTPAFRGGKSHDLECFLDYMSEYDI